MRENLQMTETNLRDKSHIMRVTNRSLAINTINDGEQHIRQYCTNKCKIFSPYWTRVFETKKIIQNIK